MLSREANILVYLPAHVKSNRDILDGVLRYSNSIGRWNCEIVGISENYEDIDELRLIGDPDGVICYVDGSDTAKRLAMLKIPQVLVVDDIPENTKGGPPRVYVVCDRVDVGNAAGEYYAKTIPASFAYVARIPSSRWSRVQRHAFCDELARRGHSAELVGIRDNDDLSRLGQTLAGMKRPVAIMAEDDRLARAVHTVCMEHGLDIPRDVRLLGVGDDEILCETMVPAISSVILDTYESGYKAGVELDRMMSNPRARHVGTISYGHCNIFERRSTFEYHPEGSVADLTCQHIMDSIEAEDKNGSIKIDDLCAATGCSRRMLEIKFRRETGRTLLAQVQRQRVRLAIKLLKDKSLKLEYIARRCGFSSESHFCKVFRGIVGKSPAFYRPKRSDALRLFQ